MTYPSQPQQQPGAHNQPNALQIRDAYAQLPSPSPITISSTNMATSLPTHFGKQKPSKLKKHARSSGSQPKRYITGSNHLPLAKRDRWMHVGGYNNTVGAEPPVEGRGDAPNRRVAGELKDMLKEEKAVMFFESMCASPTGIAPGSSRSSTKSDDSDHTSRSDASFAAYSLQESLYSCPNSPIPFAKGDLSTERAGKSGSPSPARSDREQSVYSTRIERDTSTPSFRTPPRRSNFLLLQGMGEGSQRNEYGKSLTGGQELGIGVIGCDTKQDTISRRARGAVRSTSVVHTEAGCDIPMYRTSVVGDGDDEDVEAEACTVSLDADLPPLAIEHPARVWNVLIHSLPAELQPVIKWTWDTELTNGKGPLLHTAHLTLILPPTHPSISQHSLFHTLPKNRYLNEYVTAVEALGGIKRWSGEPRKLKADAQNTALVKCIMEDGLAWVQAPDVDDQIEIDSSDSENEKVQNEESVDRTRHHCSTPIDIDDEEELSRAATPRAGCITSTTNINEDEIAIDQEADVHIGSPVSPLPYRASCEGDKSEDENDVDEIDEVERRFSRILNASSARHIDVKQSITFDPIDGLYGAQFKIAHPTFCWSYETENRHRAIREARGAVCRQALDLYIDRVIECLHTRFSQIPTKVPHPEFANTSSPSRSRQTTHEIDESIDWESRLQDLCDPSGLDRPAFREAATFQVGGFQVTSTVKQCAMDVSVPDVTNDTLTAKAERSCVARWILMMHFIEGVDYLNREW